MIVVADASPLQYLIQLDEADLLRALYQAVHIPEEVFAELTDKSAPPSVRQWMFDPPPWLIRAQVIGSAVRLDRFELDKGEAAAIRLALNLNADALLADDRAAVRAAREFGIISVGTLSIFIESHKKGLGDGYTLFSRLLAETNFYCSERLRVEYLEKLGDGVTRP